MRQELKTNTILEKNMTCIAPYSFTKSIIYNTVFSPFIETCVEIKDNLPNSLSFGGFKFNDITLTL